MRDIGIVLDFVFLAIWPNNFSEWNTLFLFSFLILMVALVILYLLLVKYKNKSVFEEDDKKNRISDLEEMLGTKDREINDLRLKLKNGETKWKDWDEEKEKLNRKIKNLERQIEKSEMNETNAKEDLIIQYYMNSKSVNQV
jgi:peptidoglycan hydrolase CwlO-like protein